MKHDKQGAVEALTKFGRGKIDRRNGEAGAFVSALLRGAHEAAAHHLTMAAILEKGADRAVAAATKVVAASYDADADAIAQGVLDPPIEYVWERNRAAQAKLARAQAEHYFAVHALLSDREFGRPRVEHFEAFFRQSPEEQAAALAAAEKERLREKLREWGRGSPFTEAGVPGGGGRGTARVISTHGGAGGGGGGGGVPREAAFLMTVPTLTHSPEERERGEDFEETQRICDRFMKATGFTLTESEASAIAVAAKRLATFTRSNKIFAEDPPAGARPLPQGTGSPDQIRKLVRDALAATDSPRREEIARALERGTRVNGMSLEEWERWFSERRARQGSPRNQVGFTREYLCKFPDD